MKPDTENIAPVFYLIYSSVEKILFDKEQLKILLNQSRDFNQQHNITGILLYVQRQQITKSKGRFMQLLEGDERIVRELYQKIVKDNRHEAVVLLQFGKYDERCFNDWSMGFEESDSELFESSSGHFNLNEVISKCNKTVASDVPLQFLQSFYND